MLTIKNIYTGFIVIVFALLPLAYIHADSATITDLSPGTSVTAKSLVNFKVKVEGFSPTLYQISDSFSGTSITSSNIDFAGNFSWVPEAKDAGGHTLTITARDFDSHTVTVAQTITVLPPPSAKIDSASHSDRIMPGTTLTFNVLTPGFANPTFIVGDSFGGSSVSNANIDSTGHFSWTPNISQKGDHAITVYVNDSHGHGASATHTIRVGEGPSLAISNLLPGDTVKPGVQLTFTIAPINFSPSSFSVVDNFPGTTLSNGNVNMNGMFAWSPADSDAGVHEITLTGTVGFYGEKASVTKKIIVLKSDGSMPASALVSTPTVAGTSTQQSTTVTTGTGAVAGGSDLDALLKKLASLQAQMTSLSGGSASQTASVASAQSSTGSTSGFTFVSYLKPGSEGGEVLELQKVLRTQGYFSHEPTGYYGPVTVDAVIAFQTAKGIDALGVVGPATRALLNGLPTPSVLGASTSADSSGDGHVFTSFLEVGASGAEVLALQQKLWDLGFFTEKPSGYFGPLTEKAVKAFQTAHEIDAKGWVGPATRAALNQ